MVYVRDICRTYVTADAVEWIGHRHPKSKERALPLGERKLLTHPECLAHAMGAADVRKESRSRAHTQRNAAVLWNSGERSQIEIGRPGVRPGVHVNLGWRSAKGE